MKIAMLGVENSHADAFGKLIFENPEKYGDIEIIGVYSDDPAASQRIVDAGYTDYAAQTPDEFLGKADAVAVVARHGDNHLKYALPYVKAGVPCFIDKPFCADLRDAYTLANAAKESGAPLCGGSCIKFLTELTPLARLVKEKRPVGGTVSCPINMVNPYGGFWFYSQHLIEMLIAVFGREVRSVTAVCPDEKENRLTVIFHYKDFDVCGLYTDSYTYYANVLFADGSVYDGRCENVGYAFETELDEFLQLAKTGEMPESYEELVYPVKLLDAIHRAYTEKREVEVE